MTMPLNSQIPLGIRPFELQGPMDQAAKAMTLAGLIEQQRARQMQAQEAQRKAAQAEAYQREIAALGPNPTQEQLIGVASRRAGPDKVMDVHQRSLDRKAQFDNHMRELTFKAGQEMRELEFKVREGRITKEEADKRSADLRRELQESAQAARRDLLGVAAALRPAPAPEPLHPVIGPNGEPVLLPRSQAAGMRPAPTAATEGLTPENAGKVAMSQQAIEGIKTARSLMFDKNGNLNKGLVLGVTANMPLNSNARIARSAMRNAVEAKLRIETGAAATESEVRRTLDRFMPTIADTQESAAFKLNELEKFFSSALAQTKGIPKPKTSATKAIKSDAEYDALPSGSLFVGPDGVQRRKP